MYKVMRWGMAFLIGVCSSIAWAQNSNSGTIRGLVTDPTGAIVPGAVVTVLDVDKGVSNTYKTNSAGLYDTGPIVTDHYTITIKKKGFETFVRGPVTLNNGTIEVNGTLPVGSESVSIVVNEDVPLIQTEDAMMVTTLEEKELKDLPNGGTPDWQNFIILMPGTSSAPVSSNPNTSMGGTGGEGGNNPGQYASVNGNAVFSNVLGDGTSMNLPANGNAFTYPFDALQELQTVTALPTAQWENGGAIFNQISKSGGSKYHGDIFEYLTNPALDAKSYAFGTSGVASLARSNYFGGSVSGHAPGAWVKEKLFFFFNFNQQLSNNPTLSQATVPTVAQRMGNFNTPGTAAAPCVLSSPNNCDVIYDPTTQVVSGTTVTRQSFACEYYNCDWVNHNQIPANLINPQAQAIQRYYPAPNNPSTNGTNNYAYNNVTLNSIYSFFYRLDYDVTPKNRISGTEFYQMVHETLNPNGNCPIGCTNVKGSAYTAQLTDVWTVSSSIVNELHLGLSTQNNQFQSQTGNQGYSSALGLQFAVADEFPYIGISGVCCETLQAGINYNQLQMQLQPSDVLMIVKGKHLFHFGGEYLNEQLNSTIYPTTQSALLNFGGTYTTATGGSTTTGSPYADFLIGYASNWGGYNRPEYNARWKSAQLFFQDDYKVRPRLTVNLGLRWEGWTRMSDAHDNQLSWDPSVVNPAANYFGETNTLGGIWYEGSAANGRTAVVGPQWNSVLPRVGVAWSINPKTVLRGGVGLYAYNVQEGPSAGSEFGAAKGSGGNFADATFGKYPVVILNQSGNVNDQGVGGTSILSHYVTAPTTPQALNGENVNFASYNTPISKYWQIAMEVQRQLSRNLALKVAYIGTHGFDLIFGPVDINAVPQNLLSGSGLLPTTSNARPYPNFLSIVGRTLGGISHYNGGQIVIDKRSSHGLNFNFNYTYSRYLNTGDSCAYSCAIFNYQDSYNPRADYGPSDYDITNMFKGRIVYRLPVGLGQQFLSHNRILDAFVGGWQASATVQWQSGNPFTPLMEYDDSNSGGAGSNTYPNVVPGVSRYRGFRQIGSSGNSNWFNPKAFVQPASYTFGNATRNTLRGPDYSIVNLSLSKTYKVWRRSSFQLRADARNVLNHPSFGLPNNEVNPGIENSYINKVTVGGRTIVVVGRLSF